MKWQFLKLMVAKPQTICSYVLLNHYKFTIYHWVPLSLLYITFFLVWSIVHNVCIVKLLQKRRYIILHKLLLSKICDEITTISFSFFFQVVSEINIQKVNYVYMFCGDNFMGFQNKMSKVTEIFSFGVKFTKFNHEDLKGEC